MAGKLTLVGASSSLDAATGRATVTARTMYLALTTVIPTAATTPATMTEYVATGYLRQVCAMSAGSGTPRVSANTAALSFGPLTGANGSTQVVGWMLVSTANGTAGEATAYGDFTTPRTPAASDSLTVAIGALTVGND